MTALAWTLVHFLWQGALIALALALCLRSRGLTSTTRYGLGVAALGVMLAAPLATFTALARAPAGTTTARLEVPAPLVAHAPAATSHVVAGRANVSPVGQSGAPIAYAAVIVMAWTIGVLVLSLRLLGGWVVAGRFARRVARPATPDIAAMVARLSARLELRRVVRVFESSGIAVPSVIGWLRPMVLLPAAALSGLSPGQVEALLAHELAHVRRRDYLVNLIQMAVETLLFYHPAVWWVSRQVRVEREHCCDDLAVVVCDRIVYVSALSTLAQSTAGPRLALAASDGSLVKRVRRLLAPPASERGAASVWLSAIAAIAMLGCIPVVLTTMRAESREAGVVKAVDEWRDAGISRDQPPSEGPADTTTREAATGRLPVASAPAQAAQPREQPSSSERAEQEAAALARVAAELKAAEEIGQQIDRQRRALERQARDEQAGRELAEVRARLETLRGTLAATISRVEVGVHDGRDVPGLKEQVGSAQRKLAGLEADIQRHRVADELEERRLAHDRALRELMERYDVLRQSHTQQSQRSAEMEQQMAARAAETLVARAEIDQQIKQSLGLSQMQAALRAEITAKSKAAATASTRLTDLTVTLTVGGQERAGFKPRDRPYAQGGPRIGGAVAPTDSARTSDGRRISGVEVIGWQEGEAVRVLVLALVPRDGTATDLTLDERFVARVDIATYLLAPGQTQTLDELSALGAKGFALRVSAPAAARPR